MAAAGSLADRPYRSKPGTTGEAEAARNPTTTEIATRAAAQLAETRMNIPSSIRDAYRPRPRSQSIARLGQSEVPAALSRFCIPKPWPPAS